MPANILLKSSRKKQLIASTATKPKLVMLFRTGSTYLHGLKKDKSNRALPTADRIPCSNDF